MGNRPLGPFGIDPLHFSLTLFVFLLLFLMYLLLPRGFRVHYFHSYPKRYAWSARPRRIKHHKTKQHVYGAENSSSTKKRGDISSIQLSVDSNRHPSRTHHTDDENEVECMKHNVDESQQSDDNRDLSNTMKQLRDTGILIVAHGSRGKPKPVRLQITDNSITWRTETKKKTSTSYTTEVTKLGKIHSVSLQNILYVDIGKQTTALRRVENAAVSESLCFSLLTKEGSLDLEANSVSDRDTLVRCFSLVLDKVHKQNWRDLYRSGLSPSGEHIHSSFDEYADDLAVITSDTTAQN